MANTFFNLTDVVVVFEKNKIHFKEKKMSATVLVITIKDHGQNGQ